MQEFSSTKLGEILLTSRETQCMYYLFRGMTAREIGETIFLSRRTVEYYVINAKNKFNCRTKSELLHRAIEKGFPFD